jgi:hypothetical protein
VARNEGEFEVLQPLGGPAEQAGDEPGALQAEAGRVRPRERVGTRLLAARPEWKPRVAGQIVDLAFELLRDRFLLFAGISTALWLPVRLLQPIIGLHVWAERAGPLTSVAGLFAFAFVTATTAIVQAFSTAIVSLLVLSEFEGTATPLPLAFRRALSRLVPLVVIAFLVGLVSGIGWVCIVPGLLLSWKLYLATSVCVLERASIGASLQRSWDLTRGSLLRWLGVWAVVTLLAAPFSTLAAVLDNPDARAGILASLSISGELLDWAGVVVTTVFFGVATAILAVGITAFYFDCRTRRDGVDLRAELARMQAAERARRGTQAAPDPGAGPGPGAAAVGGASS